MLVSVNLFNIQPNLPNTATKGTARSKYSHLRGDGCMTFDIFSLSLGSRRLSAIERCSYYNDAS